MTLTAVIYWIALPALSVVRWRFLGWREANLAHWRHIQTVGRISAFHPNQPLPRGNLNGRVGWKADIRSKRQERTFESARALNPGTAIQPPSSIHFEIREGNAATGEGKAAFFALWR
ncbi:MAG: hypothetical protein ACLP4V_05430, partial [Methylocella sp.]